MSGPPPATISTKKRSRPDVAERIQRRKVISNTCVSFKWRKLCSNPLIRKHLPDLLTAVNKLTLFVYPFLSFYACRLYFMQVDKPDMNVHVKWDEKLIRMVCCGLLERPNWRKDSVFQPMFDECLDEYIANIRETDKGSRLLDDLAQAFKGMSFFITELSAFMWTMCENHLKMNIFSRVVRWIQCHYEISNRKLAVRILMNAYAYHTHCTSPCPEDTRACEIVHYLGMFPNEENIRRNFNDFVKLSIQLLFNQEWMCPSKNNVRFSIFPTKSGFSLSHVAFSNSSLQQFLTWIQKREKLEHPHEPYPSFDLPELTEGRLITKAWFDARKSVIWRTLFNVTKLETGSRTFANRISTNGYSCSITMEKPKAESTVDEPELDVSSPPSSFHNSKTGPEYQLPPNFDESTIGRVVGIDPGSSTLFCASVLNGPDGDVNQLSLSTKQYRHESRMHEQRYYYQQLLKNDPEFEKLILSTPSFKTTSTTAILDGVYILTQHVDALFEKLKGSALPKFKFKVKRFSSKTLTEHCKKIVGKRPQACVVGVGDWSRSNKGGFLKGGAGASPNKKFLHELRQRKAVVVMIDEHNTSQRCHECTHQLGPVYLRCSPTKKQKKKFAKQVEKAQEEEVEWEDSSTVLLPRIQKVHHVLHCTNNECSMHWNRDVNSSLHHLDLAVGLVLGFERPSYLCRKREEAAT